MGMMGRLTERDREQIAKAVEGVALNDIGMIQDAVLALGEFRGEPDPSQLYKDIRGLMAKVWNRQIWEVLTWQKSFRISWMS